MEVQIPHALEADEVARRVVALSEAHSIEHRPDPSGQTGELAKATPFGPVQARYRVEPGQLVIEVFARPAFLPQGAVRRALEDNLREALSG